MHSSFVALPGICATARAQPDVPPRANLTKEQYMAGAHKATTINHFHEKLVRSCAKSQQCPPH
jgi:hypothetical protein